MKAKLQVLICTYGERYCRIDASGLPALPEVSYLVCCQNPEGLSLSNPQLEGRPDVELRFFADKGLSRNRNHAFEAACAPIVLISDDDISYSADGLKALISTFEENSRIDIVTTRSIIPEQHIYPADGHDLSRPFRFYSPISFEIALRLDALREHRLGFSELAGIGAPYLTCSEENFFLRRALRSGLRGIYRDVVVSTHRGPTTCTHSARKPGTLRAKGAFMRVDRGNIGAIVRYPLEAMRSELPFPKALIYLWQGFFYSIRHRKEL
ncbi:MAG: glycosyltransferase [Muribaculaceae bacterium]|nr:glycosyltransferase [Muribaculaceae bacterium]